MADMDGKTSEMARPSMKQDDHPDHHMPATEHNGTQLSVEEYKANLARTSASNYAVQPGGYAK